MTKKVGLLLLSLFVIFRFGVSFADIIDLPKIPEEKCIMFNSVKVGNGRIISANKNSGEVKEEHEKECISYHNYIEFYVLDYSADIYDVSLDNVKDKAKKIMINQFERSVIVFEPKPIRHEFIYQVILNGSGLYETQLIEENRINLGNEDFSKGFSKLFSTFKKIIRNHYSLIKKNKVFGIARFLTIIIESIILFIIAKLHWKNQIFKNGKLITTGILASTVTLPLLLFVLPTSFRSYGIYMILGEILVIIIETFIIKYSLKIKWEMAIFASIVCNLCSFIIGLFIF